jgi:hypothetical protein
MLKKIRNHIFHFNHHYAFLLIITMVMVYAFYKDNYVKKHGIITVAKVINWDNGGDGSNLYLDVYHRGQIIKSDVAEFPHNRINKYFFVKINKDEPKNHIQLLDIEAPQCLIDSMEKKLPFEGWKEIPKNPCK